VKTLIVNLEFMTKRFAFLVLISFSLVLAAGCKSKQSRNNPYACGGLIGFKCPPDQYCNMKDNCGGVDREGECESRPEECESKLEQACGCDGITYGNPCFAALKGVSIRHPGECGIPQQSTPAPSPGEE
jgi:hypothetical protein